MSGRIQFHAAFTTLRLTVEPLFVLSFIIHSGKKGTETLQKILDNQHVKNLSERCFTPAQHVKEAT